MTTIDFSRFPAQEKSYFKFKPGNTVCLPWGRGAGKSWFLRNVGWFIQVAKAQASKRRVRIHHLMPTLEQARRVHGDLLEIELESTWSHLGGKLNRTTWTTKFPCGSSIQWLTAERAKHQRGIRSDVVTCDEVDDMDLGMLQSIVTPFFSEPHSLKMMLLSGTPAHGRRGALYHYAHELPKLMPSAFFSFHATCWDAAKAGVVDLEYVKKVQATTPETIFKREWMCDFDSAEGLIFPEFKENFHVRVPPVGQVWSDIMYVADHGYTDPGVILTIGLQGHGRDAVPWIIDEVYETERGPDWWKDKVRERVAWHPDAKWYADPARPDLISDWKKVGARMQEVHKFAGSVEAGIDCMKRMLHVQEIPGGAEVSRLYVHPKCVHTIDEFGSYRRRKDARNPEIILEEPEDDNNHAMDALRYGLVTRFEPNSGRNNGTHLDNR